MYKRLFTLFTILLLMALSADGATKRFTLVIDAGHGGHDAGACGRVSKEKTLTLRYALAFGRVIEQNCPDVKVIYTRKTDRFLELWQRAEIANKNKADLFVSVHINSLPKGHVARGYQTYTLGTGRVSGSKKGIIENLDVAKRENAVILYEKDYKQHYAGFDPNSPESNILFELVQDKNMENSIKLAKEMQRYICKATRRQDKGVQQDNLAVLRLSSMPACLLELGFISTADEEQYLCSDQAVTAFSRGFYQAFVAYKNKVAPGVKVPYKPMPDEPQVTTVPDESKQQETEKVQEAQEEQMKTEPVPQTQKSVLPQQNGASVPVFKVQLLVSDKKLKANSPHLKGVTDVDYYREGGLYKYTTGASANYQDIYRLRKELLKHFPQAFIVAFKDGEKMNVNEAIREYKASKNK